MPHTNRIYRLYWPGNAYVNNEDVCCVVASTPGQAKSLALRESDKAQKADFLSLRVAIDKPYEEMLRKYGEEELDFTMDQQQHLYDFYTERDHREELLDEYWADQ